MITKEEIVKKLSPVHTVVLAAAGDEYKLVYNYHMTGNVKDNRYVFYGILPKSKSGISSVLYGSCSLDAVLAYIEKTFPLMQISDWKDLDILLNNAKEATALCGYTQNEKTLKAEDVAYKKLNMFCKKHGLWE